MSITLQLYEDTGTASGNKGSARTAVTNIGWRANGQDDTSDYVYNPIVRDAGGPYGPDDDYYIPFVNDVFVFSYKKYNHIKWTGTYPAASRLRVLISGDADGAAPDGHKYQSGNVRVFYKLSDTYETPDNNWRDMIYVPNGESLIIYPKSSTTGPEANTAYPQYFAANTTYYSQYLVTMLAVSSVAIGEIDLNDPVASGSAFGNIGDINIKWYFDEYEGTNV